MSRKRPTESPWDSDDELLNEDLAAITAFPDDKEDDLDEDKLLASDEEDIDWNQIGDDVANQASQDISGPGGVEIVLEPDDEDFLEGTTESGYGEQNEKSLVSTQEEYDMGPQENEGNVTLETTHEDQVEESHSGQGIDEEEESDSDNEREVGRGRFRSERTSSIVSLKSTRPKDIPEGLEISQAQQAQIDAYEHKKESERRNKMEMKKQRFIKKYNQNPYRPRPGIQGIRGPQPRGPMGPMGPRMSHPASQDNMAANKILINPHFRGSVQAGPNTRLTWDDGRQRGGPNMGMPPGPQGQLPVMQDGRAGQQFQPHRQDIPLGGQNNFQNLQRPPVSQAWMPPSQPQIGIGLPSQGPQINLNHPAFQQPAGNFGPGHMAVNGPVIPISSASNQPFSTSLLGPVPLHAQNNVPFDFNHQSPTSFDSRQQEPRGIRLGFQAPHINQMVPNQTPGGNMRHSGLRQRSPPSQHRNSQQQVSPHGPGGFPLHQQQPRNPGPAHFNFGQNQNGPQFHEQRFNQPHGHFHRSSQEVGQPISTVVNQRNNSGPRATHPDYVQNKQFHPKSNPPQSPVKNRTAKNLHKKKCSKRTNFPQKNSTQPGAKLRPGSITPRTAQQGGGLTTAQLRNRMAAKKILAAKKMASQKRTSEDNGVSGGPSPPKQARVAQMVTISSNAPRRTVLKSLPVTPIMPPRQPVKMETLKTTVAVKQDIPASVGGDPELAKRLEDQRKKREEIIKMKELRRQQAAGVRRAALAKRLAEQGKSIDDIPQEDETQQTPPQPVKQVLVPQQPRMQQQVPPKQQQPNFQQQQQQRQQQPNFQLQQQQRQQHSGLQQPQQEPQMQTLQGQGQEAAGRGNVRGRGRGLRRPGLGFQVEQPSQPPDGFVGPSGNVPPLQTVPFGEIGEHGQFQRMNSSENLHNFQSPRGRGQGFSRSHSGRGRGQGFSQGGRGMPQNRGHMRGQGHQRGGTFHGIPGRGSQNHGMQRGNMNPRGRGQQRGGVSFQGGDGQRQLVQLNNSGSQNAFQAANVGPAMSRAPNPGKQQGPWQNRSAPKNTQVQGIRQTAPEHQASHPLQLKQPQQGQQTRPVQPNAQQRVVRMNSGGGGSNNNQKGAGQRSVALNAGQGQLLGQNPGQSGGENTSATVRIDNLSSTTNDKTLLQMCNVIGPTEYITMMTNQKRAVVRFAKPEHASTFSRRFNRCMVDLSHINVQLIPD